MVSRREVDVHQSERAQNHSVGSTSFSASLRDRSVWVFSDNITALSYLRRQGGRFSWTLNAEAQLLLRWAESMSISVMPQFIMGARNVVANSLSRCHQVLGSEWTLAQEVVDELQSKWPVMIDLSATSLNYRLPVYFSPLNDPMAAGTDASHQN